MKQFKKQQQQHQPLLEGKHLSSTRAVIWAAFISKLLHHFQRHRFPIFPFLISSSFSVSFFVELFLHHHYWIKSNQIKTNRIGSDRDCLSFCFQQIDFVRRIECFCLVAGLGRLRCCCCCCYCPGLHSFIFIQTVNDCLYTWFAWGGGLLVTAVPTNSSSSTISRHSIEVSCFHLVAEELELFA